ncbi:MAG: phosphatase PAP2 family protein [Clostridia bacterium]|nr:phosphatase PAP2 family protein [Clostridia bacterium]
MLWEAQLINGLQSVSNGFMDTLMGILTYLGDEVFVVVSMAFIYWCVSKKTGFKFMNIYFLSSGLNAVIKTIFRRPRPFTAYSDLVQSIGEETSGFSFPSGHTNNIATISALSCTSFNKKLKIFLPIGLCATAIVMFTRLYLGQHYLTDVLSSAFLAIIMVIGFSFLYSLLGDREERIAYGGVPLALASAIVVSAINPDSETVKHVLEIAGVMMSVQIGYYIDKKFIGYESKATLKQNLLKILIGAVGAVAVYIGLRFAFKFDTTYWLYGFLRFFLLGAWLTLGAPVIFKKLGLEKKEKEITETL